MSDEACPDCIRAKRKLDRFSDLKEALHKLDDLIDQEDFSIGWLVEKMDEILEDES